MGEIKHKKNSQTIIMYRIIKQWCQNDILINDRLGIKEKENRKQKRDKIKKLKLIIKSGEIKLINEINELDEKII